MTQKEFEKLAMKNKNKAKITVDLKGTYEYQVTNAMADYYKKLKSKEKNKGDLKSYIMEDINNNFGLMGVCTKVIIGD